MTKEETEARWFTVVVLGSFAALVLFVFLVGDPTQQSYNGRCLEEGLGLESSGPDLICYDRNAYNGGGAYVRP